MAVPEEKLRRKLESVSRRAVDQTERTAQRAKQLKDRTTRKAKDAGIDVVQRGPKTPR